jgi:hypothetical protein
VDQAQYEGLHAWMLDKMERFQSVFTPRIQALPQSDGAILQEDDEGDDGDE